MSTKTKTINKGESIRFLVLTMIAMVPLSFLLMSTAMNVTYGIGMSLLAGITYGIFGVGEVALGLLISGATPKGKSLGAVGLGVLIGISLFTSIAVKHAERYAINADAKNITSRAESTQLAESAALKSLTLAQSGCEQATAEYNKYDVGSRAANRRKTPMIDACKLVATAQATYDKASENAEESSGNLIAQEDAIYHVLADSLPIFSAEKWATVMFFINSIALCFGFFTFSFVWSNQRHDSFFRFGRRQLPGEKYVTTLEPEVITALNEPKQLMAAIAKIKMKTDDTGCYKIDASINGVLLDMYFDTGASVCMVSDKTAKKLNLIDSGQTATFSTASGEESARIFKGEVSIGNGINIDTAIAVSENCTSNLFAPSCLNEKYNWSIDGDGSLVVSNKEKKLDDGEYSDKQLENARKRIAAKKLRPTVESLTSRTAKSNWRLRVGKRAASKIIEQLAREGLIVKDPKTGGHKFRSDI